MGAGTPRGPGIRPPKGGDGPGIRPPKGGFGGPGIRPPKSEPTPPPRIDPPRTPNKGGKGTMRSPKDDGFRTPELDKKVADFDKLLEGIKKSGGLGGQKKGPYTERFVPPLVSRPAPGSNIPLGPDDRPIGFERPRDESDFITPYGDTRDPNYAEQKKAIFEKYGGPKPGFGDDTPRPPKRFPVDPRTLPTYRDAPFGDIGIGGGPGIPPRFPTGPRDPRTMRGPRKRAVSFGGKPPSTGSKRPTKGSPRGGMSKAGPVDAETRNKFEEMLAYMKSFQR